METPLVTPPEHLRQPRKSVTVFGASWCLPGSELYAEGEALGRLIAAAGFKLVNGGYAGKLIFELLVVLCQCCKVGKQGLWSRLPKALRMRRARHTGSLCRESGVKSTITAK
jgi:hypothetical protein